MSRQEVDRLGLIQAVRNQAMELVRERYTDFGPTRACEKLRECHQLTLSVKTPCQWMITDGLRQPYVKTFSEYLA